MQCIPDLPLNALRTTSVLTLSADRLTLFLLFLLPNAQRSAERLGSFNKSILFLVRDLQILVVEIKNGRIFLNNFHGIPDTRSPVRVKRFDVFAPLGHGSDQLLLKLILFGFCILKNLDGFKKFLLGIFVKAGESLGGLSLHFFSLSARGGCCLVMMEFLLSVKIEGRNVGYAEQKKYGRDEGVEVAVFHGFVYRQDLRK